MFSKALFLDIILQYVEIAYIWKISKVVQVYREQFQDNL